MKNATIRCGGVEQEIPLALPKSFAARRSLLAEGASITPSNADRVAAAALGLCWAHPKMRLRSDLSASRFDVLAYGGDVLDELGMKGWDLNDAATAGMDCWVAVADSLTSPKSTESSPKSLLEEAQEQTDFSDPQREAGTTSPA